MKQGFTQQPGLEAVVLTNTHGIGVYYYFDSPAFATPGTWVSQIGAGTLVVSVPEPDALACVLLGLAFTGFAVLRRDDRPKPIRFQSQAV